MSMIELTTKVEQLRELRRMAEELSTEITSIEDQIKETMTALATDELHGSTFKITWKPVTSSRLDSKALKAEAPELWNRYSKQTTSRRFVVV